MDTFEWTAILGETHRSGHVRVNGYTCRDTWKWPRLSGKLSSESTVTTVHGTDGDDDEKFLVEILFKSKNRRCIERKIE